MFFSRPTPEMVTPNEALPGRDAPVLASPQPHVVLGTDLLEEPGDHQDLIYLAAGCYWGVEEIYWQTPGVIATSVGFMGGFTPNPTYAETCTGLTGHTETVRVVYDTAEVSTAEILKLFFEMHDPTTLHRQGNDVGTQYRSAIFTTTAEQFNTATEMKSGYERVLADAGRASIVTDIVMADSAGPFYLAEDEHQQYLQKVPNGYRCHSASGLACPVPGSGPLAST